MRISSKLLVVSRLSGPRSGKDVGRTDRVSPELMALKWRHAGQACITANRVYVQKGVYQKFADIIAQKTKEFKIGHGAEKGVTLGPVTTPRSLDKAEEQIADAKKHGGQIMMGGNKLHGSKGYDGYFFEPTIITGAKGEMLITREETFAPIMALYEFDTEDEVVQKANDTSMGLASCKYYTIPCWSCIVLIATQTSSLRTSTAHGDCLRISRLA